MNYDIYNRPTLLAEGDRVTFQVMGHDALEYLTADTYMGHDEGSNADIFYQLGMTEDEKYRFCSGHYGYGSNGGSWPSCFTEDYPALTRVVNAIFQRLVVPSGSEDDARVPVDQGLTNGFQHIVRMVLNGPYLVTPGAVKNYLRLKGINIFSDDFVRDALSGLASIGLLVESEGTYTRTPDSNLLTYIQSKIDGQTVAVFGPMEISVLRHLRQAPSSVSWEHLDRAFGDALTLAPAVTTLMEMGYLRWEKGYYTNPDYSHEITSCLEGA